MSYLNREEHKVEHGNEGEKYSVAFNNMHTQAMNILYKIS